MALETELESKQDGTLLRVQLYSTPCRLNEHGRSSTEGDRRGPSQVCLGSARRKEKATSSDAKLVPEIILFRVFVEFIFILLKNWICKRQRIRTMPMFTKELLQILIKFIKKMKSELQLNY